jgi:hypothetical protein
MEYESLLNRVGGELSPLGYVRSGSCFRKKSEDFLSIIEFQKSKDNIQNGFKFTVNLGIIWKRLLGVLDSFEKAKSVDSHLMERIGFLLDERRDKWWVVASEDDLDSVGDEVVSILMSRAIPYLGQRCKSPRAPIFCGKIEA